MGFPEFTPNGILPEGIHKANLEEIRERFCSYGDVERRELLFKSLYSYIQDVSKHKVNFYVCIDGSYVTQKDSPGDLDVLILYDFEYYNKEWGELISDKTAPLKYKGLQILSEFIDSYGEDDLLDFAQDVKDNPNLRKGIVKVIL
ncbi:MULTISPECIES: DUF6932 family protein [Clostridium]|uniref:DUF6932 family protein n=1 Tax=Clostridium TaxID=1485 RepID=UPI000BE2F3A4|nr:MULTISPECIES: hypothetical protein [Clostridium]MBS4959104.1 hypothetical protein [Clostridium sp.]